jgi:hypothetical protein
VEIAVPVTLGLWLEPTLPVLLFMAFAVLAHMLTTWWDTSLAQPRRYIAPLEQQIHGWLEMLPVFALVSVALLNAGELTNPRWRLQLLEVAPPPMARAIVLLALATGLGFTLEEWLRARRFSAAASASAGAPRR